MPKKYTILVIPEGTHHVKRFHLSSWLLPFLCIFFIGAVAMAGFWYHEYRQVCRKLPDLAILEQQTRHQQVQMEAFAQRLAGFKEQMAQLRSFNHRLRVLANLEKPKEHDQALGVGGPEGQGGGVGVRLSNSSRERLMMAMQRDLDNLEAAGQAELEIQQQLAKFLTERRSILASTPSIWPVRGWVTSGFGYRISPFTGKRAFHAGIDISTRRGTPIIAPADGVVTFAGWEGGYGRTLVINHGHGLVTRYGHLYKFKVKKGQKVKRGQVIALVGNTGRSSGPHLHYEVLMSGVPTNPRYYILD